MNIWFPQGPFVYLCCQVAEAARIQTKNKGYEKR
jgi:hypothetical protein